MCTHMPTLVASNRCHLLRSWFDCLLMHVSSWPCSCSQIRFCHFSPSTGTAIGEVMFLRSQHYTNDEAIPRHLSSKVSAVNSGQFGGRRVHRWHLLVPVWNRRAVCGSFFSCCGLGTATENSQCLG